MDVDAHYRRYAPMVLRRCRALLRHEARAVDAMQDVFVELVRHKDRLHDAAPANLLMRISTRVCLNRLRTERRHPETQDEALLLEIAQHGDEETRGVFRGFLRRAFQAELPSTREIAVLHWVDGMTLEEVAEEVGLSVSGVRKRLRGFKARAIALDEVQP